MVQNDRPPDTPSEPPPEASPPVDTQSPRFEARRMEILRRAAVVFRRKGFHGAGMREIAAGLGIRPGALYHYFPSKQELLYACQVLALGALIGAAESLVDDPAPVKNRLRSMARVHLDTTLDTLGGSAAHVQFYALDDERLRDVVNRRNRYESLLRAMLRQGIDAGEFHEMDEKLAALAYLGSLNWTVVWWRSGGTWTPSDLIDGLVEPLLRGWSRPATDACPSTESRSHADE